MDAMTKLRLLAGLEVDKTLYAKGLSAEPIKEDVVPGMGHTIKGEKNALFYLVTNATKNSEWGDVISEVDGAAFAQIFIGAGRPSFKDSHNTVAKEEWVLFPHSKQKEAVALAKARIAAVQGKKEEVVKEATTATAEPEKGPSEMKKTKGFYLERARAAIEADEDVAHRVAAEVNEDLNEVKERKWFKVQVATWLADKDGENFSALEEGVVVTEAKNDKAQDAMLDTPEKIGKIDAAPVAKNTSTDVKKADIKDTKNDDVAAAMPDKAEKVETLPDQAELINEPMTSEEMTDRADEEGKVKVPANIKKAMTDKIAELKKLAKHWEVQKPDLANYYTEVTAAFEEVANALQAAEGCRPSMLALYLNQYATPTIQEMPPEVWKFLVNGGKVRSLADHFKEVKLQKQKESK